MKQHNIYLFVHNDFWVEKKSENNFLLLINVEQKRKYEEDLSKFISVIVGQTITSITINFNNNRF